MNFIAFWSFAELTMEELISELRAVGVTVEVDAPRSAAINAQRFFCPPHPNWIRISGWRGVLTKLDNARFRSIAYKR